LARLRQRNLTQGRWNIFGQKFREALPRLKGPSPNPVETSKYFNVVTSSRQEAGEIFYMIVMTGQEEKLSANNNLSAQDGDQIILWGLSKPGRYFLIAKRRFFAAPLGA
jgi:hypothetical protein